jgi:putative tryptophan/tyrosine transport system substrate-binding protein
MIDQLSWALGVDVRRRDFIAACAGSALWPFHASGQQLSNPVIGFLHLGGPGTNEPEASAFRKGLSEAGYSEGRNVTIEYRWAEERRERLPALVTDLVRRQVAVIAAMPSSPATAAKAATTTIPIVFWSAIDPISIGLVTSLSRPGGNLTGVSTFGFALEPKRLRLAQELVPNAPIALMIDRTNLNSRRDTEQLQETARTIGQ